MDMELHYGTPPFEEELPFKTHGFPWHVVSGTHLRILALPQMLPLAQVYTPFGLSCGAGAGGGAMAEFHHPNVPDMEAKWDICNWCKRKTRSELWVSPWIEQSTCDSPTGLGFSGLEVGN